MVGLKLCMSDPSTGRTVQKEISEEASRGFIGKSIGEAVKGELFDLTGYEFQITGGSDHCGFPMRKGIKGAKRKKVMMVKGVGLRANLLKGIHAKKTVCGESIHDKITQVNLKVTKKGKEEIFVAAKPAEEKKKE